MSAASFLQMLLRVVRDLSGFLLVLVAGAIVFLLFTQAGAQLVLREVESRFAGLHTEDVEGTLWGPLRAGRFVYEDEVVVVEVEALSVDWSPLQTLRARLVLSELRAEAVRVVVKDRPVPVEAAAGDGAPTRLPFDLEIGDLRAARVDVVRGSAEPLGFKEVALAARWRGDDVHLRMLRVYTPWVGAVELAGDARLQPQAVEIGRLGISGFIEATIDGHFAYAGPSDLQVQWTALRWPPQGEDPQLGSDGGSLHWQGTIDDWRFDLAGGLQTAGETLRIEAGGTGSLAAARVDRLFVDSGYGRVEATANLQYEGLRLDAQGRVAHLEPQHWLPQFDGLIQGDFSMQATLADTPPDVRFELSLDDSRVRGQVADVDAAGRWRGETLVLDRAEVRVGRNRLDFSGQVLPELALEARIDGNELTALLPELSGRLRARLRARGPLQQPRLSGEVTATDLYYGAYGSDRADIRFDLDPARRVSLDANFSKLSAGTFIERAEIDLRGTLDDHRLTLDAQLPRAQIAVALEGAMELDPRRWNGRLVEARLTADEFPPLALEAPAALRVEPGSIELEPACLDADTVRTCAALRPVDGAQRVAFRLHELELGILKPWLDGLQAEGSITGHGYLDLGDAGLEDLRLELQTSRLRLTRAGLPPLTLLPGHLRVTEEEQALDIVAELPLERGGLRVTGRLAPGDVFLQRGLEGDVRLEVPELSWLHVFNFELQEGRGQLTGRIRADGTLAAPRFDGRIDVRDASVRLRTPGIRLEDLNAAVIGSSDGMLQIDARARSGDGVLRVDGRFDPWQRPLSLTLRIAGEDFLAVRTPDAKVWVTPALDLELAGGELHVDGTVDVPRAAITPKRIGSGVSPSADQVIVRAGDEADGNGALGIHADVRLRLGEDVRFEGFGLNTQLTGAVRVIEAPGVPTRARGELQLVGGRYEAYGQELTLETGKLLFTGGALTQPAVQLRATRQPREDITVGVLVRGTLDKPEFSLFSTPAMPQEQQLSWLVLGRSLEGGTSGSDRGLVADAAVGLGLAGGEWLAQRLGGRIGLDEVSVGAKPGESTERAQFTVGKYLSPRLFISYGVSLFQPGQSFRLLYDIGRGFKLATETGVESGGDLLYTIER